MKAAISTIRRRKTRFSNVKSMDYLCFHNAFEEALRRGFDEAILLNNRQEIVEGSRTNIFFIKKGVLYTPGVNTGCLNGITRQLIIRQARRLKISFQAVHTEPCKLMQADEAFVTNSLIGIVSLVKVEEVSIGRGLTGPITKTLKAAYNSRIRSCPASLKSV